MDCGADDTLCQILAWLFQDNEFFTGVMAKWLGETGILGAVSAFLRDHGEKLIGLAGVSFGFYRWWRYREAALHKRLLKYLAEDDRRLRAAESYLLEAIQRPRPGAKSATPLFASAQLRRVLQRYNWDGTVSAVSVEDSVEEQLSQAKSWLDDHLKVAKATVETLNNQLSAVHLLSGAVVSAQNPASIEALKLFRSALSIHGNEANLVAKELVAHCLRKMGRLSEALRAYEEIEQLTAGRTDREHVLIAAKAKRYQAEVTQAQAVIFCQNGQPEFIRTNAFNLISPNAPLSALTLRAKFAPYEGWDQLDQADLHYLAAFLAHVAEFGPAEQTHLGLARIAYEDVAFGPVWNLRVLPRSIALRRLARKGLRRTSSATQGHYDTSWLLPPLRHQPKQQPDGVGAGGGDEGVADALP